LSQQEVELLAVEPAAVQEDVAEGSLAGSGRLSTAPPGTHCAPGIELQRPSRGGSLRESANPPDAVAGAVAARARESV